MSAMRDDSENQLNEVERVLDQAAIAYPREEATQAERVVSLIQQRDDLLAACEIALADYEAAHATIQAMDNSQLLNDSAARIKRLKDALAKAQGAR